MRTPTLKQACLAAAQIIAIAVCLIAPASAEAPKPTPPPLQPTVPIQPSSFRTPFSEALKDMVSRASELLPIVRNEIEGPLLPWLEKLSLLLAGLIMMAAFAKMWRENAGAGVDLFWWFARLGVVFALLGSGPKIVEGMFVVGREIAVGVDGQGALFQFYLKQQANFDKAYTSFNEGVFTVKGDTVKPVPGGVLGVLLSAESSARDPVRKLDGISRDMPFLYNSLNFSRGVISFGDFFLTMLGGFLMIAMRLAAPVMIALAIDRSVAQRVTYPYLWGVVVLTEVEVARAAETKNWKGQKVMRATDWGGDLIRTLTKENTDSGVQKDSTGGLIFGETVRVAGSAYGLYQEYTAIQERAAGNTGAINAYTDQAIRNQDAYAGVMKEANNARAGDFIKAANTGADISSAGARRGYGITVGGYNQAYNLALQGNDINFKGTLKGAEKVRDAAVEAARLRSVAAVVSSVGHNIARDMEQGLTLRY